MYQLLETIKVHNYSPQKIFLHQMRMDFSYQKLFKKQNPFDLLNIFKKIVINDNKIYKWRVEYNEFDFKTNSEIYKIKNINTLKIIEVESEFDYSLKFTNREKIIKYYDLKSNCDDIIFVKNGFLTDSSYTNLVFKKNQKLYSPNTPLLKGTMRHYLIENNIIKETAVKIDDIKNYEGVYLINSMMNLDECPFVKIENIF